MQEDQARQIKNQPRFGGIFENGGGFDKRVRLTSHLYDDCLEQYQEAVGNNLNGSVIKKLETRVSQYIGAPYAIAMNSGTSAMHMAYKLAARKVYGADTLKGKRVFCSDMCPIEQAMPILYENGIPVFIDVDDITYNMDPECLKKAFDIYPDTKIVAMNHVYGFPGQISEVKRICEEHEAILIENASESFGARVDDKLTGSLGDISVLDFGQDKIITGGLGGMLLTNVYSDAEVVRTWINMSRRNLPWNHTDAIGYDYRMNDLSAAMILGQLDHIDEIIAAKKKVYETYVENINEDLAYLIRTAEDIEPNYWMPFMMCDSNIDAVEARSQYDYSYKDIHGTSSPMEIVDAFDAFGADAAPVYMPMSEQPVFKGCELITIDEILEAGVPYNAAKSLFLSGTGRDASRTCLCLPSDLEMTSDEQMKVIEIVHSCFSKADIDRKAFMAVS